MGPSKTPCVLKTLSFFCLESLMMYTISLISNRGRSLASRNAAPWSCAQAQSLPCLIVKTYIPPPWAQHFPPRNAVVVHPAWLHVLPVECFYTSVNGQNKSSINRMPCNAELPPPCRQQNPFLLRPCVQPETLHSTDPPVSCIVICTWGTERDKKKKKLLHHVSSTTLST